MAFSRSPFFVSARAQHLADVALAGGRVHLLLGGGVRRADVADPGSKKESGLQMFY